MNQQEANEKNMTKKAIEIIGVDGILLKVIGRVIKKKMDEGQNFKEGVRQKKSKLKRTFKKGRKNTRYV